MDILDDMWVSKLSAKVFFFFKWTTPLTLAHEIHCPEEFNFDRGWS